VRAIKSARSAAAALATIACLGTGTVGVAAARARHQPSPAKQRAEKLARAALLRAGDLHGWKSAPAAKKVPTLTCGAFDPDLTGIETMGSATSPTFNQSSTGPFASQLVDVFKSAAQERSFWHRVVGRALLTCVADSLAAGSTSSVTFTVDHKRLLSVPRIGEHAAGYRVIGTAAAQDGSDTVYLDMLVVGRGSAVSAISFTSFFDPVPRSLELRLARLVANRLPSGTAR
jgi:hypothetical protein